MKKLLALAALLVPVLLVSAWLAVRASAAPAPAGPLSDPDALRKGLAALRSAAYDEALELFLQVPASDPGYAKAQRMIGWEIYAEAWGRPAEGLAYVNRAMAVDPFDGNVWQDFSRAWGSAARGALFGEPSGR